MPDISGAEVIRAARQARPDLPTVLMTGYADADALGEDFRHVVLLKRPFRLQDLEAALGSAPFAAGSTARKWQCDPARSISPLTPCWDAGCGWPNNDMPPRALGALLHSLRSRFDLLDSWAFFLDSCVPPQTEY